MLTGLCWPCLDFGSQACKDIHARRAANLRPEGQQSKHWLPGHILPLLKTVEGVYNMSDRDGHFSFEMEATTKHNGSHGFWVLVELSQRLLWASEFPRERDDWTKETPKSKHSKAFLQHPDDPGLLFPFSAMTLHSYVMFRTPTSEPSNSWPTCTGQGAVLLEKLGHVTPKVRSALWHGTDKVGMDSLWSRQLLCLMQMEVRRDLVQSHVLEWTMGSHVQKPYFAQ